MNWLSKIWRGKLADGAVWETEFSPEMFSGATISSEPGIIDAVSPRFSGTASDVAPQRRNNSIDDIRLRLRSAFTPSQPVSNLRMFAGRNEVLRTLIRAIEDQQLHVVLYGDRGIGKTSLLHVLAQVARQARYIVRYTSCGEVSDFSETFRAIAADIPLLFHADYDPTSDAIERGGSLADLLPEGPLSVNQVSDTFGKISGTRVLVILDEFDRAQSAQFRRLVAEMIKNLSDRSFRVQIVIAGVASNLTELIAHIPSVRRNIVGLPVPNMSVEEVRELLEIGESASGLTFDAEALTAVIAIASGLPYLASLIGQHAGLSATERRASLVQLQDVETAIKRATEEVRHRISPKTIYLIDSAIASGHGDVLVRLARTAITRSGMIDPANISGSVPHADDAASANAILPLFEPIDGDPIGYWRFAEDGAALFIWISQGDRILSASRSPLLAKVRAES